jgi:hypothetical protein
MDIPRESIATSRVAPVSSVTGLVVALCLLVTTAAFGQSWANAHAVKLVLPSNANDPSKTLTIQAPSITGSSFSLTLPNGNTNGVLQNDGSGNLSWQDVVAQAISLSPASSTRNVIQPTTFSVIPLVIKQANSQIADLQEWQNTSASVLAKVDASGNISTTGTVNADNYYKLNGSKVLSIPGTYNVVLGYAAGGSISSGLNNVFVGDASATANTSGTENTFIGSGSGLQNSVGNDNVFVGMASGRFSHADSNTFIGAYAGLTNNTGHENTTLGVAADVASSSLTNAMALGYRASVDASNKIQLGNTSVTLISTSGAVNSNTGFRVSGAAASGNYLRGNGTNFVSSAIQSSDLPGSFSGFANPPTLIGLTTVNGTAVTAMRSDAAPALDQSIAPTWTGAHTFAPSSVGAVAMTIKGSATSGDILDIQNNGGTSTWLKVDHAGLTTMTGGATINGGLSLGTQLSVGNGGTGQTSFTDGQLLIGNSSGNTLTKATLTQGSGITITNGNGSISIANGGVTALTGTTNQVNVSASTGVITLSTPQNIATSSSPTFASMSLTNTSNQLALGTTNTTTLSATAPSTSRTYTLPDAGANANVALVTGTINSGGVLYASSSDAMATSDAGSAGQILESNGTGAPTWGSAATAVYGDGIDGSIAFDGNTTPVAGATRSGSTYTMTRDIVASAISVSNGVTVKPSGYRIYCNGTITNNGTIQANGNDGSGSTGGALLATTGFLGNATTVGTKGGNGGANANGAAGTNLTANAGGGAGGAGGTGGGKTAGAAGSVIAPTAANGGTIELHRFSTAVEGYWSTSSATVIAPLGGSGGGGGGGGAGSTGGGAGGGGGLLLINAFKIDNSNGVISASGGNGANGTGTNAGGGGGGGGGVMWLIYHSFIGTGTHAPKVDGGTGGTGVGNGLAGSSGNAGTLVLIQN